MGKYRATRISLSKVQLPLRKHLKKKFLRHFPEVVADVAAEVVELKIHVAQIILMVAVVVAVNNIF